MLFEAAGTNWVYPVVYLEVYMILRFACSSLLFSLLLTFGSSVALAQDGIGGSWGDGKLKIEAEYNAANQDTSGKISIDGKVVHDGDMTAEGQFYRAESGLNKDERGYPEVEYHFDLFPVWVNHPKTEKLVPALRVFIRKRVNGPDNTVKITYDLRTLYQIEATSDTFDADSIFFGMSDF